MLSEKRTTLTVAFRGTEITFELNLYELEHFLQNLEYENEDLVISIIEIHIDELIDIMMGISAPSAGQLRSHYQFLDSLRYFFKGFLYEKR